MSNFVGFDNAFINSIYVAGDIVTYDDLYIALGDGYGDPGNVQIATLDNIGWYPAGYCSRAEDGVWDPDETKVFPENEYGKTWVAVCNTGVQDWAMAYAGSAYLFDV